MLPLFIISNSQVFVAWVSELYIPAAGFVPNADLMQLCPSNSSTIVTFLQ